MARRMLIALFALTVLGGTPPGPTQEMRFFRIGTGGVAGTYYPIGGLIADIISSPPGARPCDKGGSCGVPGLVAIAQSSNGSVANVDAINVGRAGERLRPVGHRVLGLHRHRHLRGPGQGREPARDHQPLPREHPHRRPQGRRHRTVRDLKGKRVSLDEPGSGTLVDARIILEAFGLSEADLQAEYIKSSPALSMIGEDQLDAFFIVAGYPIASVVELASGVGADLVPIDGPEVDALLKTHQFFARDLIPAGTYEGIGETPTISVGAQWMVGAEVDEELVYGITKALWHRERRASCSTTATPKARRSRWRPRSTASASRCIPAPSATTGRPGCSS